MRKLNLQILMFSFVLFSTYQLISQTWQQVNFAYTRYTSASYKIFSSPNNILVAAMRAEASPASYISLNGGTTWQQIFSNKPILSAEFGPDGTIYLITARRISGIYYMDSLFSSPNGTTWINLGKIPFGTQGTEGKDEGDYVVSKDNKLLFPYNVGTGSPYLSKSTNNGSTWSNTAYMGSLASIACSPTADTIVLGTYNSGVRYSHDGGVTFNTSIGGGWGATTVGGSVYHTSGDVYTATLGSVYKSTNGGQTFSTLVPSPFIGLNITEFDYSQVSNKFYVKVINGIYETTGCITYSTITSSLPNTNTLKDMALSNNYIYAITDTSLYRYQITPASGITENSGAKKAIVVYPNPTTGLFSVNSDDLAFNKSEEIEVFDVLGHSINVVQTKPGKFDLSACSDGFYYIRIKNSNNTVPVKLILKK